MEEDKTKEKEYKVACLECDTETFHKVIKSVSEHSEEPWGIYWANHEIIMCQGCRTISFRLASGTDDIIGEDYDGDPIYDTSVKLFPSRIRGRKQLRYAHNLPVKIYKIYSETHKALSSEQPILAGIGIRALVESVCTEKDAKGSNLKERINNLVEIGVLTKEGAQILDNTRIFGNESAHEIIPIKDEDLGILMDIAENLLENTYILPVKARELAKRAASK
ncbi:MAG: DUF4145 domain-containing protein [Rickettsiaceae bacterium]|nr:DUF4145 domain-containing protein [Rickettsiaceae bacterium]